MDALEDAKRAAGQSQQDVLFGGLEQKLTDLAERVAQNNNQPLWVVTDRMAIKAQNKSKPTRRTG